MLKNWIKIFVYNTAHNKTYTLLNIIGLAIGITAVILSSIYWEEENSYDKWNPNKELVQEVLVKINETEIWPYNVAPLGPLLKEAASELDSYCYYSSYNGTISLLVINGKKQVVNNAVVTEPNFFEYFPFEVVKGSVAAFSATKKAVALSEEKAVELFGTTDVINKIVQDVSNGSYTITTVYRVPGKSSINPSLISNDLESQLKLQKNEWGNFNFNFLIKLKNTESKDRILKTIEDINLQNREGQLAKKEGLTLEDYLEKNGRMTTFLQPLEDVRLKAEITGFPEGKANGVFLKINIGLSVLILVLSIINYINLATAQATKRAKEVGIRKITGAGKKNIVLQFIFETSILVFLAFICALALTEILLPYYNVLLNKALVFHLTDFIGYFTIIFLIVIISAGIFPALYIANFQVLKVLKGNFGRSKNGIWLRNTMLIVQFFIATLFLIAGYIVNEQVSYMAKKDLGFSGDQILTIRYLNYEKPNRYNFYKSIRSEMMKIKGVKEVNISSMRIGSGVSSSSGFSIDGKNVQAQNVAIDFGYLDMMKIKIAEGRDLDSNLASDTIESVLINQTAARKLGNKNLINKKFDWNGNPLKIVGIVEDFNLYGLTEKVPPMIFYHPKTISWMDTNLQAVSVKIDAAESEDVLHQLEKFWKTKVDFDYPFNAEFVNKEFAKTYASYIKQRNVFAILNIVVIAIALFGLFALSSFTIERQYKQIAIKKVLGASTKSLLLQLSKQYILFCIIGFLLALIPGYYLLQLWLNNFAYRIDFPYIAFCIAFIIMIVLTIIVVFSKSYSATRINILKYLKYE